MPRGGGGRERGRTMAKFQNICLQIFQKTIKTSIHKSIPKKYRNSINDKLKIAKIDDNIDEHSIQFSSHRFVVFERETNVKKRFATFSGPNNH